MVTGLVGGDCGVQLVVDRVSGGGGRGGRGAVGSGRNECASVSACLTEFPRNYNSPNPVRKICVGCLSARQPYCKASFLASEVG